MITIERSVSVGAGLTVNNLLEGELGQILTEPSRIVMAYLSSLPLMEITVLIGGEIAANAADVPDKAGPPSIRDDIKINEFAPQSTPLIMRVVNNNAAANVIRFFVIIEPV